MGSNREARWTVHYVTDSRGVKIGRDWTAEDSAYTVTRNSSTGIYGSNTFEVWPAVGGPAISSHGMVSDAIDAIEALEAADQATEPEPARPVYTHVACPTPVYLAILEAEHGTRVEIAPYFTVAQTVDGTPDTAEYVRGCQPLPQPIEHTTDVYTPTDAQTLLVSFLGYAASDASLALPHVFRLLETARRSAWSEEVNSAGDTRVRVEDAGLGYYRLAYTSQAVRYTASITPEEWQNDQAVEVDAPGEQTWDCTAYALANLDYLTDLEARSGDRLADPYGIVDGDDLFKSDPAAPSWVSDWSGPFTLRVTRQR